MADQGPDWEIEDVCGDRALVYAVLGNARVGLRLLDEDEDGPVTRLHFDLPRLDALLAELTRRRALLAGEAGEAPVRSAEIERADVVAYFERERRGALSVEYAHVCENFARAIKKGEHVGSSANGVWAGPGYYAGRDLGGRSATAYADTPEWLARIGAAVGVARWSGPHASLADAGKALAEGGQ